MHQTLIVNQLADLEYSKKDETTFTLPSMTYLLYGNTPGPNLLPYCIYWYILQKISCE